MTLPTPRPPRGLVKRICFGISLLMLLTSLLFIGFYLFAFSQSSPAHPFGNATMNLAFVLGVLGVPLFLFSFLCVCITAR